MPWHKLAARGKDSDRNEKWAHIDFQSLARRFGRLRSPIVRRLRWKQLSFHSRTVRCTWRLSLSSWRRELGEKWQSKTRAHRKTNARNRERTMNESWKQICFANVYAWKRQIECTDVPLYCRLRAHRQGEMGKMEEANFEKCIVISWYWKVWANFIAAYLPFNRKFLPQNIVILWNCTNVGTNMELTFPFSSLNIQIIFTGGF